MIKVDFKDRTPLYSQIIASVKALVLRGIMLPDEQMPSVRLLSTELAINPNTIQKAYNELERSGIIYTVPGRGSFISSDTVGLTASHLRELTEEFTRLIREMRKNGITRDDAESIIDNVWRDEND